MQTVKPEDVEAIAAALKGLSYLVANQASDMVPRDAISEVLIVLAEKAKALTQ